MDTMLGNGAPQPPQPHMRNGSSSNNQYPRHMSTGSLNIPNGQSGPINGASPRADGAARSPPTRQNTGHVPCKFFRQGTCQAGQACPFSHDLASTTDNVCKYFSKGNCKFGPKCANIHVLPDGRRINYKANMPPMAPALNLGGRINPDPYHGQGSALTNSFARAQGVPTSPYGQPYGPFTTQEDGFVPMVGRQQSVDINIPTIDTSYASHPGSNYGSPRDDMMDRFGLGLSPVAAKGLSVLDAPLPASFDSNGVSWIARHGKVASSVPTKFGIDSPPSSVGGGKPTDALRSLHSSAFGDDTRDRFNGIASSPPSEEYFGKRTMHSQRSTKPKIISASLPREHKELDWSEAFSFEEDLLPEALHDLMTPAEKARRNSRAAYDESKPSRVFYDEGRSTYSGTGTPSNETPTKFGSPSNGSPSSRWGAYFQPKAKEEEISRASVFGHVGSPLRNSLLHEGASPSSRPIARPNTSGDALSNVASPPRQTSMSIISQQLQRTRLSRAESNCSDPSLLSSSATRTITTPIGSGRSAFLADRQPSSTSIGGSGRFTTPIDEEQGDFVFNMEGMDDDERSQKRSSPWNIAGSNKSPSLGAVGGGRSIPANKTNGSGLDGMFGGR
ncbi:40bfed75-a4ab-4ba1-98c9-b58317d531c5 [Sclerotinia trifoliorum]|uniref:40bfed75-a4ab-4ba1-98c9-b58317d531c5 n=1 Tax=Sclerotinia trifoliorum TaxID=28548 RepID=A0A8H2W5J5_9HELO|nr:40bfed75-a4ab-4ba1-98c9-b58317d531c5 [Sclerotinia trifoliorum]